MRVAALARACNLDIEYAARALAKARRPRLHTFIATSDIHLKFKLRKTRQQVLDAAVAGVEMARKYVDDVEFSAEDATRTNPEYLEQVCRAVWQPDAWAVRLRMSSGS
jgi:2-isopropylmalate synthase